MLHSVHTALTQHLDPRRIGDEQSTPATPRAYRIFCVLSGSLVIGFWFAYRVVSDAYIDPLWIRIALAGLCLAVAAISLISNRVARHLDHGVFGLFCILGIWFVVLTALNGFATDYAVGLLFVVAAVSIVLSLTSAPRFHLPTFQALIVFSLSIAIALCGQSLLSQFVLLCCLLAIMLITWVGSKVRSSMEEVRAEYRHGVSEANRRAEDLLRVKSAFFENMNHEIRTPLTGILGYAEILAENADSEHREYARVIRSSGQRLMETLTTILDLASLEAGEFDLNPGRVDLEHAAEDAVDLLRAAADQRGLPINFESARRPVIARGDHAAVRRVIYNIISNAIKFTAEGSISIRVYHRDGRACVAVVDTGIGIDRRVIPDLFCEFTQASSGVARTHEGTGLGLAISKRLAVLMDGHIDVDSKPGAGSTFTLSLPVYTSRVKMAAA